MTRTISANYGTPGLSFPQADDEADPFLKEDVQSLSEAVDLHDHSAGRGLAIQRLASGVVGQANIANDAVGFDQLSDSASTDALRAVGSNHLRNNAVVARTIADGEILATKLGVGASAGLTFPRVYAGYTLNSQTLSNNTLTPIIFSAADIYDNANMHSPSVTNTRVTIGTTGWYLLFGFVKYAASATGVRELYFRLTRAAVPAYLQIAVAGPAIASVPTMMSIVGPFELAAADYIELVAYQGSGGALVLADAGFGATAFGS